MYLSCLNGGGGQNAVGHVVGHIRAEAVPGADVKRIRDNGVERQVEDLVTDTMAQVVEVAEAE